MNEENKSPVHQTRKLIQLIGGPPWGFRIQGGKDTSIPLKVARVSLLKHYMWSIFILEFRIHFVAPVTLPSVGVHRFLFRKISLFYLT